MHRIGPFQGEIIFRTGCQFGVPGGTYPPKKYPSTPPSPAMLRVLQPMYKPLARYQVVAGCEKLLQKVENRRSCEFVGRSAAQREQGGRQGERRAHPLPHPLAVFFCLHLFDPSPRSELLERAKSNCNFCNKICTCCLFYRSKTNFGFAAGNANAVTSACFNRSEVSKFTQIVPTFFLFVAKQVARFCGTFYLSLNFTFFFLRSQVCSQKSSQATIESLLSVPRRGDVSRKGSSLLLT